MQEKSEKVDPFYQTNTGKFLEPQFGPTVGKVQGKIKTAKTWFLDFEDKIIFCKSEPEIGTSWYLVLGKGEKQYDMPGLLSVDKEGAWIVQFTTELYEKCIALKPNTMKPKF